MDIMRRCTILYILTKIGAVFVSFIRTAQNAKAIENENNTLVHLNKQVNVLLAIPVMGVERSGRVPGKGGHI